jgi:hypothetical protein
VIRPGPTEPITATITVKNERAASERISFDLFARDPRGDPRKKINPATRRTATDPAEGAIWDWQQANPSLSSEIVVPGHTEAAFKLSWNRTDRTGHAVARGNYEMVIPLMIDGTVWGYAAASYSLP